MTPDQMRVARHNLGYKWGKDRPLHMSELGRALRLKGRDIGASVRDWEGGHTPISGPVEVAIEAMLRGFKPND
jgi:hypothetical protein